MAYGGLNYASSLLIQYLSIKHNNIHYYHYHFHYHYYYDYFPIPIQLTYPSSPHSDFGARLLALGRGTSRTSTEGRGASGVAGGVSSPFTVAHMAQGCRSKLSSDSPGDVTKNVKNRSV